MKNTATYAIHADTTISITDLRRHLTAIIEKATSPVAIPILDDDHPIAYLMAAQTFEDILEALEDVELAEIVRQRRGGKTVKVSLDEL